jgi:penicillin-binding protein 1A
MGWFRRAEPEQGQATVPPPVVPPRAHWLLRLTGLARPSSATPSAAATASGWHPQPDATAPSSRRVGLIARLPWKWRVAVLLPAFALLFVVIGFCASFLYYTMAFPDLIALRHKERSPVIRILARDGEVIGERGAAHDYTPLDLLPAHVVGAVVATEDRRFYEHWGIDPWGLTRAAFANLRARRFVQGGSTLTQQLAKNLFLTSERSLERKLEELALAFWLELRLSKQDILELYLNRVYFGAGAYGVEAAAQRYFEKSARALTIPEAAVIAGLLKAPSRYSPAASPGAARGRARVVLSKMRDAGLLSPEETEAALSQSVRFADPHHGRAITGFEYAIDHVLERLPPIVGAGHAEFIVETTIDAAMQRRAVASVQRTLSRQGEIANATQGSLVVLDTEGGIRALVGGRSYAESQFNRAVKARRQPGSAFKPFVYLAALEAGLTPDTVAHDLPVMIGQWSPRNDNGQYLGAVTLRQGLSQSINTVAVRLQQDVGTGRVINTAQRLGIRAPLQADATLALGTSEVALLDLTSAYAAFANGGRKSEPHIIRRVRLSSGRLLSEPQATRSTQVVAPQHVGAMNDMLNAALVAGTGRRAALPAHPAAGKTGTTQDFRDAWFVGYTAHLVGGVWIGNDNGRAMTNVRGGSLPAEIWREVMGPAHEGRAPIALPGTLSVAATPREPAPDRRPPAGPPIEPVRPSLSPAVFAPPLARTPPPAGGEPLPPSRQHRPPPLPTGRADQFSARTPLVPRDRIDPAFVARMTGLGDPDVAAEAASQAQPGPTRRPPPDGMMALGRR